MAFSFGSSAPAPAPSTSFNLAGATSTAPAPFGSPAAPAAPAFGAPAATTPAFGSPAPAFGAPAPAFGAPAPAFGAATSATAPGGSFFGAPAPAAAPFGAASTAGTRTGGFFGAPAPFGAATTPQQPPAPAATIAGNMRYTDLPPHYRNAIDQIHKLMMDHKRTINQVQACGPAALYTPATNNTSTTHHNAVATPTTATTDAKAPLPARVEALQQSLESMHQQIDNATGRANDCKLAVEELTQHGYMYAKWPLEAVAVRRGLRLTEEKKSDDASSNNNDKPPGLNQVLDQASARVDRMEAMPSPYLWHTIHELEQTVQDLDAQLERAHRLRERQELRGNVVRVQATVEEHHQALYATAQGLENLHSQVQQLCALYADECRRTNRENLLDKARAEEQAREQRIQDSIQRMYVQSATATAATAATPAPGGFGTAAAPATTFGGFGATSTTSPAPAFGGFGSSAAPKPVTGFGSTPATTTTPAFGAPAAPATTGGFGAPAAGTTAATGGFGTAPAFGSSGGFSAAPAPFGAAPVGGFGAPATGGFGITAPSTPKKKSGSRSSGRLNKR